MGGHLVVPLIAVAVVLAYVNGLHNASNSVSTTIATGTLTERAALSLAAALNGVGALVGLGLVKWTGGHALDVLDLAVGPHTPVLTVRVLLLAAATTTVVWEIATWRWGMPSSSWHAMLFAMAGGALALGATDAAPISALAGAVGLVGAPLIAGLLAFAMVSALGRLAHGRGVRLRHLRVAQTLTAGLVAFVHGMRDSALPTALILAAGLAVMHAEPSTRAELGRTLPLWALIGVAAVLAVGTYAGGHRIIRTLARRVTYLSTPQGLAAEAAGAIVMLSGGMGLGAPISTTQTVTAGIIGSGLAVGRRSVRWVTVGRILGVWALTPLVGLAGGAAITSILAP